MQTYTRRDTWGRNPEVRPIGEPTTHKDEKPENLVGRLVLVRPFYYVPDGRSSLKSARSPFVFEAHVMDTSGLEMVKVRFAWATDHPWNREAVFYPSELHVVHMCECAACVGAGIVEQQGA